VDRILQGVALDWQEEYKRKLISAEEAANLIKSGDSVMITGREPLAIGLALAARKEDLKDVQITLVGPGYDFGWYDPGWEESFKISTYFPTAVSQEMVDERRCDILVPPLLPAITHHYDWYSGEKELDVFLVELSTPDEHGFCSYGNTLGDKKKLTELAKLVIAEANPRLVRTCGENYVHVSQIDYFVEHVSSGRTLGSGFSSGSLIGRDVKPVEPSIKQIAENVSQLIRDRATLQIGGGRTTEPLIGLGMLADKHDLGLHSELTLRGIISLVRSGVINGKYKTLNPGKAVVTSVGGGTAEEMDWVQNNPLFWMVDLDYLEDCRVIAAHDDFVAINNVLAANLSGEMAITSLGTRRYAGVGGQLNFVIGALLSKGGRSISVLPSTARDGSASRIVPQFPPGTAVGIPQPLSDYVVTEYGIAKLRGKTLRERANELIDIAHPDFRAELRREAQKLYWP
jgi:4-hydroxybutyrate CoA-transferase